MRTRFALDLAEARAAVDAGLAFAARQGWAVSIAVVDDSGNPIVVQRMDEATPTSFTSSLEKARSAAFFGVPTKAIEAMFNERPALLTLGRVGVEGGLPIIHQGQRVGGIAAGGLRSDQDAAVAAAALAAIQPPA